MPVCHAPRLLAVSLIGLCCLLGACAGGQTARDPYATLGDTMALPSSQRKAMETLDANPEDPEYLKALHLMMWKQGFVVDVREQAFTRLEARDLENLKRTIRQHLPRLGARAWQKRLCEIIAARDWKDLSPALVSSWAQPQIDYRDDMKRPEYLALASLYGSENVIDVVYTMFLEARTVAEANLRMRCWNLLHRLGQRERLIALLTEAEAPADDALLIDLQAGARDLGMVPNNKEEILWLRTLRTPEQTEFWQQAVSAVALMEPQRRAELEIRDLPIVVSASLHEPDLLAMDKSAMFRKLEEYLKPQKHYLQESNYDGYAQGSQQRIHEYRDQLTWGDLAAMLIAIRAIQVPQIVHHLFDYADRDRADKSTEYGGVIRLDDQHRFEIIEFIPRIREHDQRFNPSQEMIDAAYVGQFHFHLHVQNYRNHEYAGPSFQDHNAADNLRANFLVFTFINQDTINVDYYRHGHVVVDLGVIARN